MNQVSFRLFKIILAALVLTSTGQSYAQESCQQTVKRSTYPVSQEIENAKALSEKLMTEFTARSKKIVLESQTYDFIVIGASVQGAAAALALRNSGKKVLILDKSHLVASNFASKEFVINTSETAEFSMHEFPSSPLRFDQFTSSKYASSLQLAAYIQSLIYWSKIPVKLQIEVNRFQLNPDETVRIFTADGKFLNARHIIIGTGLGEASTKVPDAGYKAEFEKYTAESAKKPADLQPVMSTESFMKAFNRGIEDKSTLVLPQTVLLVGNGDGARITVEEMSESFVKRPAGFKIVWVGQESKTATEYTASQEGWDRYLAKVVPFFERGEIQSVPGYTQTVTKLANGKYQMTILDQKSSVSTVVEGDMIVDSTGYENRTLKLIAQSFSDSTLVDFKGNLQERGLLDTNLAKQVQSNEGKKLPVYLVGAGAGMLPTKAELKTQKNGSPVAIHNNVPRTSQLIYHLLGINSPPRNNGAKSSQQETLTAAEIYQVIQK